MSTWQLQEAQGKFSEVVKRALKEGPQDITVRGEPVVVVISLEEYSRLIQPKPGFLAFMRASPLMGAGVKTVREQSPARKIAL